MAKDKVTVTLDPLVVGTADAAAREDGISRSEYVERVLRDAHYRRMLAHTQAAPLDTAETESLRDLLTWQAGLGQAA